MELFSRIESWHKVLLFIFIPLLSMVMHYRVFNMDIMGIHAWRQTVTQSNIVNFYEEDPNIFRPRLNERGPWKGILRMEFPLMQWLFAQSFHIFGNHFMVSRILSFIIGLFSVWGMFYLIRHLFRDKSAALFTAWAFCFSPVFYYYTMNPLPDNFSLCFSIWGAALSFKYFRSGKIRDIVFASFFICIATLSKLPFIVFYGIPAFFFLQNVVKERFSNFRKVFYHFLISFLVILPSLVWYVWVVPQWQNGITIGILSGRNTEWAKLADYFGYHLLFTFPFILLNFIALPLFFTGLWILFQKKLYRKKMFIILAGWGLLVTAYFVFEINMIERVHDYYLFPFLPPIFVIVAYGIKFLVRSSLKSYKTAALLILIMLPLSAYLRIDHRWNPESPGFNKDLLMYKNELRSAVPDTCLVVVGNDPSPSIWLYYVNKKGWVYRFNNLTPEKLEEIRGFGGKYMYSDSREIDADTMISSQFEEMILEKGSIRVFRLKPPD